MTEEIVLSQQEYDELISICTSNRDKYSKLVKKYKELQKTTEEYKDIEKAFELLRQENQKLRKQSEEIVCLYAELDKARNRIRELENAIGNVIVTPAKKTAVKEMFSYL